MKSFKGDEEEFVVNVLMDGETVQTLEDRGDVFTGVVVVEETGS